jgi:hypothetical protein
VTATSLNMYIESFHLVIWSLSAQAMELGCVETLLGVSIERRHRYVVYLSNNHAYSPPEHGYAHLGEESHLILWSLFEVPFRSSIYWTPLGFTFQIPLNYSNVFWPSTSILTLYIKGNLL